MYITILSNGFVFACKDLDSNEPDMTGTLINLYNARCIQTWGTTRGPGQLIDGPIDGKTILNDMIPIITLPKHTMVFYFKVSDAGWKDHLS